jgi:hypothetical protein
MPPTMRSKQSAVLYNPNLGGRAGQYSQLKDDSPLNGAKMREKCREEQDDPKRCSWIKLTVHMATATPLKEKLLQMEWATRCSGTNPTCLHFGINAAAHRAR